MTCHTHSATQELTEMHGSHFHGVICVTWHSRCMLCSLRSCHYEVVTASVNCHDEGHEATKWQCVRHTSQSVIKELLVGDKLPSSFRLSPSTSADHDRQAVSRGLLLCGLWSWLMVVTVRCGVVGVESKQHRSATRHGMETKHLSSTVFSRSQLATWKPPYVCYL